MKIKCPICLSQNISTTYEGPIRIGILKKKTPDDITMHRCTECGLIWHKNLIENLPNFYQSNYYRSIMNEGTEADSFYEKHDVENQHKLQYTGTTIFRNKIIADIGCGAGAFLDFVKGSAKESLGIEPTKDFHDVLQSKQIKPYSYASEVPNSYHGAIDIITSFDVIEHVEQPLAFMKDIHLLLNEGGTAIIGSPTSAPVLRNLLGPTFDSFLFSTQHLWVFSEKSLEILAKQAGFSKITIKFFQRYGMKNAFLWLKNKQPQGYNPDLFFVTDTMEAVFKKELEQTKLSDYIVMYCHK